MIQTLNRYSGNLSLKQILIAGFLARNIAVIFSAGYGFHDDHFEVIELAWKWKDGLSFTWDGNAIHMFSLLYPGLHYLIFSLCHLLGIDQPEHMMIVVRALHAVVSMGGIYYAWHLSYRLGGNKMLANSMALLLALGWFFPFLSVRSLREVFCIPFLLAGCYHAVADNFRLRDAILSAICFAIAFDIRMQIIFIPLGIGVWWLFHKASIRHALIFGIAFLACIALTQGLFDQLYYGNPLASTLEYLRYNSDATHIGSYPQGPWYMYAGTLALFVLGIPILLLYPGVVYSYKISAHTRMLLLSLIFFFLFHSFYSNKQERFILPALPLFVMLGLHGLREGMIALREPLWLRKFSGFALMWFLVLNTAGLILLTVTYSKKARVESMVWLREQKQVRNFVLEGTGNPPPPPLFYLQQHLNYYTFTAAQQPSALDSMIKKGDRPAPDYVIMAGSKDLDKRLERLHAVFPHMEKATTIEPGFIDNIAYRLNPKHNQNEAWFIYRIQ